MLERLNEQAQGFQNFQADAENRINNFDTDKAIQQGTEIAYRHGNALLQQGRQQLEALAGTELVAGASEAIPAIYRTAQAISKRRDQINAARQTNQLNQRLANIRADTDLKPVEPAEPREPTDEEYGLPDLDKVPAGYLGRVQARGDDGSILTQTGRNLKYNPSTGGVETETGEPAKFGEERLAQFRTPLEQESFENPNPNQQRIGIPPDRQDFGSVDLSGRGAQARANQQFRESAPKPSDLELPDIPGFTDPNVAGARSQAAQPGVARPIEPQVPKPSFDPTAPVEGEVPAPARPQQYPASRGPAQAPSQRPQLPEPVDYTEGQSTAPAEVSSAADTSGQVSKGIGVVSQDIPTIATAPRTGGIPGVDFGGQTTTAPTPVPATDTLTSRVGTTAVKAGAEEGAAEVGATEAVGGILDAIPGLDILGAAIGIAGIASGIHGEHSKPSPVAPPVQQPMGTPSSSIAFDAAPVFDSSDYHNA